MNAQNGVKISKLETRWVKTDIDSKQDKCMTRVSAAQGRIMCIHLELLKGK